MPKLAVTLAMPLLLACAACQHTVTIPPAACATLIPDSWREPVEGAPLPDFSAVDAATTPLDQAEAEARRWMQFGVEQTGQLEKANGRAADTVHIFENCENLANDARPRRRFLGIF